MMPAYSWYHNFSYIISKYLSICGLLLVCIKYSTLRLLYTKQGHQWFCPVKIYWQIVIYKQFCVLIFGTARKYELIQYNGPLNTCFQNPTSLVWFPEFLCFKRRSLPSWHGLEYRRFILRNNTCKVSIICKQDYPYTVTFEHGNLLNQNDNEQESGKYYGISRFSRSYSLDQCIESVLWDIGYCWKIFYVTAFNIPSLGVNKNPTDATVCRYLFTAKLLWYNIGTATFLKRDLYRRLRVQFLILLMMGAVTPETCRVVLQWINICILLHLLDFYLHWITMHGTTSLKKKIPSLIFEWWQRA